MENNRKPPQDRTPNQRCWSAYSFLKLNLGHGLVSVLLCTACAGWADSNLPIDRYALVTRHNVVLTHADPFATLQAGNGEFAIGVDITGLQTFPAHYREGIQLGTQAQWAWGSAANPENFTLDDVMSPYDAHGRQVLYADGLGKLKNAANSERARKANAWLRENPHRLQLGRLGIKLQHTDGTTVTLAELRRIRQTLDLWSGIISSQFESDGELVQVQTVVHPQRDMVAVRIESALIKNGQLGLEFERVAEAAHVHAKLACSPGVVIRSHGNRDFATATNATEIAARLCFSQQPLEESDMPSFEATRQAAANHWRAFWNHGGAVDLSGSRDPRWHELERRIVLSQYLTAIQCAGSMPPQETGLAQNSWFGKFHLEMHWWHAAHFALWGRPEVLERSLGWYRGILPAARSLAKSNGYAGARWPKMTAPQGEDSPSGIGPFLIWQQPHPIYLGELVYRVKPQRATLEKYRELVLSSAEFMASYTVWDENTQSFVLGPPLIPAQESYGSMRQTVINPTFELAYWCWGLQTAQQWRERLGLARASRWDEASRKLAKPCIRNGIYEAIGVEPFTLTQDHPSLLQAYGFLPSTRLIDPEIMGRTFTHVLSVWDWKSTWGWDYPVLAMTAARLGRPEEAVNALLMDTPKNRFMPNGHNYQRPNLPLYLPGNGGLLAAIAMMTAGWDGAPPKTAPGFPDNGQWTVRWEGLHPMP